MKMDKTFTFADRIKSLMEMRGLSKSQLAKLCGINKSNITRYCNGSYEAKQDVIYRIAEKLNISEAWLMGYDVPMYREGDETGKILWELAKNSVEDQRLLELYHKADERDQDIIWSILGRYTED